MGPTQEELDAMTPEESMFAASVFVNQQFNQ